MEKQHEINSIGVVYFVLLLANIMIFTGFLVLIGLGVAVPDTLASFLCELVILLPVIIYLRSRGDNISDTLGFHRIKVTTVLLTVLLTIATYPVFIFANVFSQLFVKNAVVQNAGDLSGASAIFAIIVTSIMAPLCEEITFRGFLFDRLKGFFPVIKAAVVSAMLFGIMHLNFNQFCYVFVLGIIFALANHASGSTWTSVIMHFLINFVNVVSIIVAQQSFKGQDVDFAQAQEAARLQSEAILNAVKVYGVLSIICVFLIWFILKAIAKNQGNLETFKNSFVVKEHSYAANDAGVRVHSLLNVPMMFSVIIGIAAMIIYQVTVF